MNHYNLLGIEPSHPQELIPQAFRNKIKQVHPDKCYNQHQQIDSKQTTIKLYEAYKIINNPITRKLYNQQLKVKQREIQMTANRYFQETNLIKSDGIWFVECQQCMGRTQISQEYQELIGKGQKDFYVKCWHCNLSLSLFIQEE